MNHTRTTAVGLEHPCPRAETDFQQHQNFTIMTTFSYIKVCSDFSSEKPFATAFFTKSDNNNSLFAQKSMQNNLYTFGLVLRGFDQTIKDLFTGRLDAVEKELNDVFKDQPTDGIECYDVTVLDVTDGAFKSVKFGEGDEERELQTFHRAYMGTYDECLADLKRQFENNKSAWRLEKA